jgi:small subunit ribosomal protein S6
MREYELVLMLDPGGDAPARDALAQEARRQIEASGTLKHENAWGLRKLAYEINQRTEADYRWFRFEAPAELLEQLDHSLKIADGVLRFRIFKVGPETPIMVPPSTGAAGPGASRERGGGRAGAAQESTAVGAAEGEGEGGGTEPTAEQGGGAAPETVGETQSPPAEAGGQAAEAEAAEPAEPAA